MMLLCNSLQLPGCPRLQFLCLKNSGLKVSSRLFQRSHEPLTVQVFFTDSAFLYEACKTVKLRGVGC